jgi:hypothetical protein
MTENRLDDREGTQADGRRLTEDEPQGHQPDETAAAAEGPEDHVDRERQEVDDVEVGDP